MAKLKLKIILAYSFLASLFYRFNPVLASGFHGLVPQKKEPLGWCDFFKMLQNIINFLLKLSFLAGILGFIVAGFFFFFSGGSEQRVASAKKIFSEVLIGFLIALASWLIIDFIIQMMAGQNLAHIIGHPWHQLQCR